MAGRVPAIHVFLCSQSAQDVDARHKAGHDEFMELEHFRGLADTC
jgi:hypothetical protein